MHQRQLRTHLGVISDAVLQLQSSLEQNDALQSERASLTNSLRKLEAFKRNLLHTLQASDVVVRQRLPCVKFIYATHCILHSTYCSVCLRDDAQLGPCSSMMSRFNKV